MTIKARALDIAERRAVIAQPGQGSRGMASAMGGSRLAPNGLELMMRGYAVLQTVAGASYS